MLRVAVKCGWGARKALQWNVFQCLGAHSESGASGVAMAGRFLARLSGWGEFPMLHSIPSARADVPHDALGCVGAGECCDCRCLLAFGASAMLRMCALQAFEN